MPGLSTASGASISPQGVRGEDNLCKSTADRKYEVLPFESMADKDSVMVGSFGHGSLGYRRAARRVVIDTLTFGQVCNGSSFTKRDLLVALPHEAKEVNWNARGAGFWAWKPLVLMALTQKGLGRADFVLYLDSGFLVNNNPASSSRLDSYLQFAREHGALTFSSGTANTDRKYCKAEVLEVLNRPSVDLDSTQRAGGIFILHKTIVRDFANEWWNYTRQESMVNDDVRHSQSPTFIEHRHDQAIFSLLAKAKGWPMSPDAIDFHPGIQRPNPVQVQLPFWAARHKSGLRSASMNPFIRAVRAFERVLP